MRRAVILPACVLWGVASAPPAAGAAPAPTIVVSTTTHVLEVRRGDGRRERFPVAVGRDGGGPRGVWYTGPDPRDTTFYLPRRFLPAFHRGLPFLRLSPVLLRPGRSDPAYRRAAARPFGLHGPVTPTLLWGAATAGCVRLRPADLLHVYALARAHPGISVRFTRRPLTAPPSGSGSCPETRWGLRRLAVVSLRHAQQDRICGGVDHWYAVPLQGGDVLSVTLHHAGALRLELYGIRAISTVARGERGLRFRVPLRRANRGARYLRIVAPRGGPPRSYSLRLERLR